MSLDTILQKLDRAQQSHRLSALVFGVIRKHGDDKGNYLAALITYYGFLSLFPLLLATTSLLRIALEHGLPLADRASTAVANFFPIFGSDLHRNIHGNTGTGITLAVGIALSLYGARGVADAFRYAVNEVWQVPISTRRIFPADLFNSMKLIAIGGAGFILSAVIGGALIGGSHSPVWAIIGNLVSFGLIYVTFLAMFLTSAPREMRRADMRRAAIVSALSFQLLQAGGGWLITRQLHNLSALYGAFAIVLGLIFYIALQAQVMIFALEYSVVARRKLWPRSLLLDPVTEKDKTTLAAQAKKESVAPDESVHVSFKG